MIGLIVAFVVGFLVAFFIMFLLGIYSYMKTIDKYKIKGHCPRESKGLNCRISVGMDCDDCGRKANYFKGDQK